MLKKTNWRGLLRRYWWLLLAAALLSALEVGLPFAADQLAFPWSMIVRVVLYPLAVGGAFAARALVSFILAPRQ